MSRVSSSAGASTTTDAAGLVVAPQFEAAHAGREVLRAGGNAADALVTAALVQGIADPHRCGIGGFGCATTYWQDTREAHATGFHGRVGELAREDQWVEAHQNPAPDGFGYIIEGKGNDVGHGSITTPGTVAGLAAIHGRHGRLPWADLVHRAADLAEEGFVVGPGLAEFWIRPGLHGRVSTRDRLGFTDFGRGEWFDARGETFKAGYHKRMKALAGAYRRLADEGPESFYRGELARTIAADLEAGGAWVTADDLRNYRAAEEPPLEGEYRGLRVLTSPLPGGGVALLQALRLLEERPIARMDPDSPEYHEELARVFRVVWADRLAHHGDPGFGSRSAEELLAPAYLEKLARRVREPMTPVQGPAESPDTTQLTIVDAGGNCVSFSHSLGYGSGVFTPGLGFMYNNCMSGFDPIPGRANSIAPGKSRSTAIAETIILDGDTPFLVLGSPGAARITAALVQVILAVVDHGLDISEAVLRPRLDAWGERTLFLEARFPVSTVKALEARGWEITQSPKPFGMVGRVYAIQRTETGRLIGGVDPGEPGAAYRAQRD